MDFSNRYIEVCDLPYCSEPDLFYWQRMKAGLRVSVLRETACRLFKKENGQLTVQDLKFAFLKMCPVKVNLGGDDHGVTVKKLKRRWILSCNCRSWIFNLSGDRRCKHTAHIENLMQSEEEKWGVRKEGGDENVQPKDKGRFNSDNLSSGKERKGSYDHVCQPNLGRGVKRR